jgi:hypothetical protein
MPAEDAVPSSALTALLRWEASGGTWAVLRRSESALELSLRTCTAGEEVERLSSADADVVDHVGDRDRSDD